MLLVILGASASGKDTLRKELENRYGFHSLVSTTTRQPRPGEKDGIDYYFTDKDTFRQMIAQGDFVEYEEYTEGRWYGTSVKEASKALTSNEKYCAVLTPNGYRALEKFVMKRCMDNQLSTVYVTAPLKERVLRYINRAGEDFDFHEFNEIHDRVNRDYGMFLGLEKEADIVIQNGKGITPEEVAREVVEKLNDKLLQDNDKLLQDHAQELPEEFDRE